jgi:hypothetical protein
MQTRLTSGLAIFMESGGGGGMYKSSIFMPVESSSLRTSTHVLL